MSLRPPLSLLIVGLLLALPGCERQLNQIRADRFANNPQDSFEAGPSAVSVSLRATPNGQSFVPESIDRLNDMLDRQGRLSNQTLTLLPHTPAGEQIAQRLIQTLKAQGLPPDQLRLQSDLQGDEGAKGSDLMVISEAIVAKIPDCAIANPDGWAVSPYRSVGTLGCANRANLARMVSDPRDLIRSRTLAPGDGIQASAAVQRYHSDDVKEMDQNTDFSNDN